MYSGQYYIYTWIGKHTWLANRLIETRGLLTATGSHVQFVVISQKWCKIQILLLWPI